ncbi:DNA/RNA non-specific endonuclease [Acutalibacter sp. LFL-21]|uniref:DNA/RNA non-specific endonuclease n=1 Tax=Acutalibacter sp. LFL-21 TaxID=2983399 RepID=UPI0021D66485|nr:DNA/RNA non-specific endonuclease [Acutalibacter sp. LFL-21]MCU7653121.1 DNA/RNA non-specific endonuclease [Acutalibacter sp. LFL-21]
MRRCFACLLSGVLVLSLLLSGCELGLPQENQQASAVSVSLEEVPAYSGSPYVELDGNLPGFSLEERTTDSFETYSTLDALGRCGPAYACIGQDLMPTEDRESISSVRPTGWMQAEYSFVDGGSLYNRCHLIGFQLTGENANEENLITGTRYMNVEGMLPFENMVADYIKETGNHVLYRAAPIFEGENLVASGVVMEALSVEDEGEGVCFHVYVYNVQPGVEIDYATGESWETRDSASSALESQAEEQETDYVLNTSSKKFHLPDCPSVDSMSGKNRQEYHGTREELIAQGYEPCGSCHP